MELQQQLQDLFDHGGCMLRKWNSSKSNGLPALNQRVQRYSSAVHSTECHRLHIWSGILTVLDHFRLTDVVLPHSTTCILTKRVLISDVSKVFNVFGWFSPSTIKMKILFQKLWELK